VWVLWDGCVGVGVGVGVDVSVSLVVGCGCGGVGVGVWVWGCGCGCVGVWVWVCGCGCGWVWVWVWMCVQMSWGVRRGLKCPTPFLSIRLDMWHAPLPRAVCVPAALNSHDGRRALARCGRAGCVRPPHGCPGLAWPPGNPHHWVGGAAVMTALPPCPACPHRCRGHVCVVWGGVGWRLRCSRSAHPSECSVLVCFVRCACVRVCVCACVRVFVCVCVRLCVLQGPCSRCPGPGAVRA
jgi:hypothetical protein